MVKYGPFYIFLQTLSVERRFPFFIIDPSEKVAKNDVDYFSVV